MKGAMREDRRPRALLSLIISFTPSILCSASIGTVMSSPLDVGVAEDKAAADSGWIKA